MSACSKWLDGELTLITSCVILRVRNSVANALIHKDLRLTKEHGQWCTYTVCAPLAMATFNPTYILRQEREDYVRVRQNPG